MRKSTLNVFLLDADVIIWCADNGKLDSLFKNKKIKIPLVIFKEAREYTDPKTGEKRTIQFSKYLNNGSLEIIDSPLTKEIEKFKNTYKICPQLAQIQNGESQCLALLKKNPGYKFCTGDIMAMKIVGFWGLSEQAISLEELVGKIKNLRHDFTKESLRKFLKIGASLRLEYLDIDE